MFRRGTTNCLDLAGSFSYARVTGGEKNHQMNDKSPRVQFWFELARIRVILDLLKRSSESTGNVPPIPPSRAVSRSFSSEIIEQAENKLRQWSMNRFSEAML